MTKGLSRGHLGARSPRTPPRAGRAKRRCARAPSAANRLPWTGLPTTPGSNYPLGAPRPAPLPKKGPCGAQPAPGKEGRKGGAAVSPGSPEPSRTSWGQGGGGLGAGSRRATGGDPVAGEAGAPAGDPAKARALRPPRRAGTRGHRGHAGSARPQTSPPSRCPESPLEVLAP